MCCQQASGKRAMPLTAALLVVLLATTCSSRLATASGVFELQFDRLQELSTESYMPGVGESDGEQQTVTRVVVCLKEAFASKLDGPCTFGNSSVTLSRHTSIKVNASEAREQTNSSAHHRHHHSTTESHMTNLVRIPFSFRWTKAFTIVLVVEQLSLGPAHQQPHQQPPPQPPPPPQTLQQLQQLQQQLDQQQLQQQQPQRITIKRYLALPSAGSGGAKLAGEPLAPLGELSSVPAPAGPKPAALGPEQPRPLFIDRHVLTENEVLPNLETNPHRLWASRFSRSLRSSIAYRFRVYCSLNYFGDGCTVFCRPRDDHFGHYNCSPAGHKVCHEGWQGPDCDRARCREGCAGHCHRPDTCLCRPGWTGPRCDQCLTYPGCGNGFCLSAWQCICHRNWGGQLCDQDLNYCGTHEPCRNNGSCHNVAPARYKCTCAEGFTGVDCDISLRAVIQAASNQSQPASEPINRRDQQQGCMLNPCLNGGVCLEFRGLEEQAQAGNRSSTQQDNLYRCQCPPAWFGDFCQWPDASYLPVAESTNNDSQVSSTAAGPSISEEFSQTGAELSGDGYTAGHLVAITGQPISVGGGGGAPAVLELTHLISWILVASIIGVFLATLILAWCCLAAVERSKFSLIQMNFVRNLQEPTVRSSTLQRFHEKIRDSLRLRSHGTRIKPETKLSIENALTPPKPPPSYEESNCDATRTIRIEYPAKSRPAPFTSGLAPGKTLKDDPEEPDVGEYIEALKLRQEMMSKEILVRTREEPKHQPQQPPATSQLLTNTTTSIATAATTDQMIVGHAQLNCPRHGHLYRQQQQQQHHHHNQQQQQNSLKSCRTGPP